MDRNHFTQDGRCVVKPSPQTAVPCFRSAHCNASCLNAWSKAMPRVMDRNHFAQDGRCMLKPSPQTAVPCFHSATASFDAHVLTLSRGNAVCSDERLLTASWTTRLKRFELCEHQFCHNGSAFAFPMPTRAKKYHKIKTEGFDFRRR